jgi:hypothetical protein
MQKYYQRQNKVGKEMLKNVWLNPEKEYLRSFFLSYMIKILFAKLIVYACMQYVHEKLTGTSR